MSIIDRWVRVVLALVLGALYYFDVVEGTTGLVLLAIGIIFLLTSFMRWCPIYAGLGLSTNKDKKD